jgi:hypothetical protein
MRILILYFSDIYTEIMLKITHISQAVCARTVESVHKAPTPTPRFLKLRIRLLHKSSICINNGKLIRHFIITT